LYENMDGNDSGSGGGGGGGGSTSAGSDGGYYTAEAAPLTTGNAVYRSMGNADMGEADTTDEETDEDGFGFEDAAAYGHVQQLRTGPVTDVGGASHVAVRDIYSEPSELRNRKAMSAATSGMSLLSNSTYDTGSSEKLKHLAPAISATALMSNPTYASGAGNTRKPAAPTVSRSSLLVNTAYMSGPLHRGARKTRTSGNADMGEADSTDDEADANTDATRGTVGDLADFV
jgi:hypothetical protein